MSGKITVLTTEDAADKAAKIAEAAGALPEATVSTEEIKAYYWWEEEVNFDPEWRVAVTTSSGFPEAMAAISKAHSYDLPMIIYDLETAAADHMHWKGVLKCDGEEAATALSKVLVEKRIVACAQATPEGALAVKTLAPCKAVVEESAAPASVAWSAIGGNEAYLKWMEDECVAAKAEG